MSLNVPEFSSDDLCKPTLCSGGGYDSPGSVFLSI